MKHIHKIILGISLLAFIFMLGLSIYHDTQRGELALSLHIVACIIGAISCAIAIFKAKKELSQKESKIYLMAVIATLIIMFIIFKVTNDHIIPKID